MNYQSKSSFIFDLINEFEIFTSSGQNNVFTDEAYALFGEKYKTHASKRDISLYQYLMSTPRIFRTFLPHSKWVFGVVSNIVWYYDQVIMPDPVLHLLTNTTQSSEQDKYKLQDLLRYLIRCKESIIGGYLLFSGDNIVLEKTGQFEEESRLLIEEPQVLNAFENSSILIKKPSPINDNPQDNLTQLQVMYEGLWGEIRTMGMYIPPHVLNSNKLADGIWYNLITPFQKMTKNDLIALGKQDLLDSLKAEYCKDITVILESIVNAQRLNSPVLFHRNVDHIVARNYSTTNNQLITDTSVYDCVVPYVQDISPEQLFDARCQIPNAFAEFRAFLFDLVGKTMRNTNNPDEIKYRIDSEINGLLRKLKTEMKIASNKWRVHGVAAPAVFLAGSLGLFSSGIDYLQLLSTLTSSGSLIKSLTTWSDVTSDKSKTALNPVYFLWKAQGPAAKTRKTRTKNV